MFQCFIASQNRAQTLKLQLEYDQHQAAVTPAVPIAEAHPNCCQYRPILFLPHPRKLTIDDILMMTMLAFPRRDWNVDLVEVALVSERA